MDASWERVATVKSADVPAIDGRWKRASIRPSRSPRAFVALAICAIAVAGTLFGSASALAASGPTSPAPPPPPATPSVLPAQPATASVLTAQPASQDFFGIDIHFQQEKTEWFYNNSGSPVTVGSVTILGDATSFSIQTGQDACTGQTIASSQGCYVNVLFGPLSSPGPKNATLELTDNTGGTADVPLSGYGITGTLSVYQSSLNFGSQVVPNNNGGGGSQQQNLTLATGPQFGVKITNVQINGPDASSFSIQGNGCQGYTIGPNSTCQEYLQFQPTSAGPKQAQLEIDNDGTVSPVFVTLSGVGLNGPSLTVSPQQAIFPNTSLGASASQTFTLTNTGDAPLQFQELFIATGSPQVFPMLDGCSGQQLQPGAGCQVTVGFIPIALGPKDASLFVLTNQKPVAIVGLSGTGVSPSQGTGVSPKPIPNGTARVTGTPQAGNRLTCSPASFPPGTMIRYQWLRNGREVQGANQQKLPLVDSDVGARFSCRLQATAPGGTQTVISPDSAPVVPLDLSLLRNSGVREGVCRIVSVPELLSGGVHAVFATPVTPWARSYLTAKSPMHVSLDGRLLGAGTTVSVNPRMLAGFRDGTHKLQVDLARHSDRTVLMLAPCRVAADLHALSGQRSELTVSSRTSITKLAGVLTGGLSLGLSQRTLGQITLERAGAPDRTFYLTGPRTVFDGVTVSLSRFAIRVTGLPIEVGVITLQLRHGVLRGGGGATSFHAAVLGVQHPLTTRAALE